MQDTLDEVTYMSVKWGRLYEIEAQSLEHSWITRHAHDLFAQNGENGKSCGVQYDR